MHFLICYTDISSYTVAGMKQNTVSVSVFWDGIDVVFVQILLNKAVGSICCDCFRRKTSKSGLHERWKWVKTTKQGGWPLSSHDQIPWLPPPRHFNWTPTEYQPLQQ